MRNNPFQAKKGYELVTEEIKRQITEGELSPAMRLPSVTDLAAAFGVGRSTVREALSALKAMGWLDIRQGGGTFVKAVLPDDDVAVRNVFEQAESLKEVLQVRKILETGCASLAASQRSTDDLEQLKAILRKMEEALDDDRVGEQADVDFHLAIAAASGNPLLLDLMQSMTRHLQGTMKDTRKLWFYAEKSTAVRLLGEHSEIVEAIEAKDGTLAHERMLRHLDTVEQVLLRS